MCKKSIFGLILPGNNQLRRREDACIDVHRKTDGRTDGKRRRKPDGKNQSASEALKP